MVKIAKKPVLIDTGVTVTVNQGLIHIAGPKGELDVILPGQLIVKKTDRELHLSTEGSEQIKNSLGLYRSLLANAVRGVVKEWQKQLEMVGVGYRAQSSGNELEMSVGFTHPVKIIAPKGISFQVDENKITVSGADKYLVGEFAAKIRRVRPPEPYKGKGIRYLGEYIRKKAGKAAKTVAGVGAK